MKFFRGIYLTYLVFFNKDRFVKEEEKYNEQNSNNLDKSSGIYLIRQSLYGSFLLILISGAVGFCISRSLTIFLGSPSKFYLTTIQGVGTLILLWATLAVRGWDIQTWSGTTLIESINRWTYRFLCCFGTILLVVSIFWT
ncbi:MAG: hypothetical protein HW401_41 [Parcubacteria group bacterium]|nr:hypothetical protein [Parcubacteria group bacterium]